MVQGQEKLGKFSKIYCLGPVLCTVQFFQLHGLFPCSIPLYYFLSSITFKVFFFALYARDSGGRSVIVFSPGILENFLATGGGAEIDLGPMVKRGKKQHRRTQSNLASGHFILLCMHVGVCSWKFLIPYYCVEARIFFNLGANFYKGKNKM